MKQVSFFHKDTGALHASQFTTTDAALVEANTPADHIAIDGHHDHLSKRVDINLAPKLAALLSEIEQLPLPVRGSRQAEVDALLAQVLVDYQPPQPTADHEWNAETRRWELSAAAIAETARRLQAQAKIAALRDSQHDVVRAMLLGDQSAAPRLQAIHDEIASLQASL